MSKHLKYFPEELVESKHLVFSLINYTFTEELVDRHRQTFVDDDLLYYTLLEYYATLPYQKVKDILGASEDRIEAFIRSNPLGSLMTMPLRWYGRGTSQLKVIMNVVEERSCSTVRYKTVEDFFSLFSILLSGV